MRLLKVDLKNRLMVRDAVSEPPNDIEPIVDGLSL